MSWSFDDLGQSSKFYHTYEIIIRPQFKALRHSFKLLFFKLYMQQSLTAKYNDVIITSYNRTSSNINFKNSTLSFIVMYTLTNANQL